MAIFFFFLPHSRSIFSRSVGIAVLPGRCCNSVVAVAAVYNIYTPLPQYGNKDFPRLNRKENIIQKRARVRVSRVDADLLTRRRCVEWTH